MSKLSGYDTVCLIKYITMISIRLITVFTLLVICSIKTSFARNELDLSLSTIEQHLTDTESNFSDLVTGTEKAIRWFDGIQQTELSIIYLHGFSASRQELNPTTDLLAERLKANIFYARLKGHGRSAEAMAEASMNDWLEEVKQAYEIGALIGKKVVVVSTSTGGTLASWLVTQPYTEQLLSNILISPNFGVKNKMAGIVQWSWGLALLKWLKGPYYSFEPQNELHAQYWTERYPFEALLPMFELLDLVESLDKSEVSIPQMVIYSEGDQVISTNKIHETITEFSNSRVTTIAFRDSTDPYQHVLAGNACSPESTEKMVELISNYIYSLEINE